MCSLHHSLELSAAVSFTVRWELLTVLKHYHINYLELQEILLALKHFILCLQGKHVLVRTDDTTVVSYTGKGVLALFHCHNWHEHSLYWAVNI